MDLGSLTASFGVDMSQLQQAQSGLLEFDRSAQSTFGNANNAASNLISTFKTLAAVAGVAFVGYELSSYAANITELGSRVELLGKSTQALGSIYGLSSQAIDYYKGTVTAAGISTANSLQSINAFIVAGQSLENLHPLANAARDISALDPQLRSTNEVFMLMIESIRTGFPRALRTLIPNMMEEMRGGVSETKRMTEAMTLTLAQRAENVYNTIMEYANRIKGVGDSTSDTYIKQQAKIALKARETQEAMWAFLSPILETVTKQKIQVWADLHDAVVKNQASLRQYGEGIAIYMSRIQVGISQLLKWGAAHKELAENILLVTVAYKVLISWGIGAWLLSGGQAAVITAGNFITLYTALRATTMINVGGYALTAAAGMGSMAAAAQAAAIVIAPLVPVVLALEAAFALLGAYKGMAIADQETTAMGGRLGPTHTAMLVAPEAGGVEAVQESQRALESVASSRSPLGISAEQRKAEVEVVKQALGEETMAWIKEQEIQAGVVARNEEMVRKFEEQNKRMMESVRSQMSSMGKPEKGGGKGAEGAEGRVQSIMSTLNQELIKINEGAANEVLAWADKMVSELEGLQAKGTDVSEVMPKVWQVALAKEQKLQEEFGKWYAGNIGDNYAKIEYERDENTKKFVMSQETMRVISEKTGKSMVDLVAQNEATKQKISEVTTRKKALEDYAQQSKLLSLAKQYYDQMAQLSPGLAEQNFNRRQALELENKLALVAVDEMVTANKKLEPYRDQLLLMQAMVNQGKLFNLEMAQNKGFSGWAFSRAQEVEARNNISSLMSSLESGIANAWTTGFDAFLAKDKQGMAQAAGNLVKSFLSEIVKRNITMVFDQLAIKFKPEQGMVSGSQEAAVTLTQAGLSCGQNILTYAEAAAAILSKTTPGGVGGFGGGGTPMFGLGGYRMPKPGELGGTGGAEGDQLEGYKAIMAQFAHSVPKFSQGASMFLPGSTQFAGAGVRGFMDASSAASQAASQSMLSNIQFGLGVAGLGLSTIGLMTGSQELVIAGFVLQTAALLLMIASKLKIIHGGGVIAHQGLLLAHSGLAPDERIIKAQVGEGVIKRSTMNLYRNQGISFEDLNEGRLPIVLPKPRESSSSLVYSPTIHVGDGVSRDDKEWFKRELRRQKDEVYDMMRKGRRNNVRMK